MNKAGVIFLFAALLVAGNTGYCGSIDYTYEVGNWRGFRTAAVSYTFDDGTANQLPVAIPIFNEFGFKATLYPVINWGPNWAGLQTAASSGHEVGSHTMSHPNLGGLTIADQTTQLANSKTAIDANIPGLQCLTLAYPYCAPSNQPLTEQYYIAARHCQGVIEANTPSNFYTISSIICGSAGSVKTTVDFIAKFNGAVTSKGWCVFLLHGIDNDGGYSPLSSTILRESLQYLDDRRGTFWEETFLNVVRYIRERNDVSVTETSNTAESITLQVTDTLNNSIYNYPITIRRPLPGGWPCAAVSQNGQSVSAKTLVANSTLYVMFDTVPDGGEVVLSKSIYGDFIGNGDVDTNDLAAFFGFWAVDSCSETAGVDLDEDCIVNFHEFAVLANNW